MMPRVLILLAALAGAADAAESRLPPADLNPVLKAPISRWDEAIPLGNGLMGGLLWGSGSTLRLSLDRGDLWDLRLPEVLQEEDWTWATLKRLVAEGKHDELRRRFDEPYGIPYPTKVPAGRLEIDLDPSQSIQEFSLDLATAEGRARLKEGGTIAAFVSAREPVALLRIPGPAPKEIRLLAPESVKQLGHPPATHGEADGARWYVQEAGSGLRYAGLAATRRVGNVTLVAVTVASTADGADPVAVARQRVARALARGYAVLFAPHRQWWARFWAQSRVSVPDPLILKQYYLVRYFYGAASRPGAPPIPLQGVWTADEGGLPPWKGDYHHDLNTQMTYAGYLMAGHFAEGRCFLDFLWKLLPEFRQFARRFYGTPGAAVPGVMSLDGKPLTGWPQYSLSPTNAAWLGWLFAEHWRYTRDARFLRERAYPWCAEVGTSLRAMLQPDAQGLLKLALSSSPEIFDNTPRAWLKPNSSYDQACLKALFLSLAEMASTLGKHEEAARWRQDAEDLGGFATDAEGCLMFSPEDEVRESHRHFSHSMAIHPFGLIHAEGTDRDRQVITATCRRYDELGTAAWCGYSFSWMACLRARVGDAEAALRNLDIFVNAFVLRNGFHCNGDQSGLGFSSMTYRPFTLEGNFLALQAVHEMLLQSWSVRPGSGEPGAIRLFPATPWRWHTASFADLRVEGGHRVSARRERNATTWLRVVAGRTGAVRIRDNFGGRQPRWSRAGVRKVGPDYVVSLKAGEVIEATLPRPAAIPPAPADAAPPLQISTAPILPNRLPLRIGADSNGGCRFTGEMAYVRVYNRALSPEEIARLADPARPDSGSPEGCLVRLDFDRREGDHFPNLALPALPARVVGTVATGEAAEGLPGTALKLDGQGFLEIADDRALDCPDGITLAAWIRPAALPPAGVRVIDKSPVGIATAYLLDTYPGNSLRLIARDPFLTYAANLPLGRWSHVAATVEGTTRQRTLYLNGQPVAAD